MIAKNGETAEIIMKPIAFGDVFRHHSNNESAQVRNNRHGEHQTSDDYVTAQPLSRLRSKRLSQQLPNFWNPRHILSCTVAYASCACVEHRHVWHWATPHTTSPSNKSLLTWWIFFQKTRTARVKEARGAIKNLQVTLFPKETKVWSAMAGPSRIHII